MQETKFYDYIIGRKMSKQLGFIDGTESSGGGSSGEDRDRGCWVVRCARNSDDSTGQAVGVYEHN